MGQELTPLEALRRSPTAITDAVYGNDHPTRGKNARKHPPRSTEAAVRPHGTRLGDVLDPNVKTRLNSLRYRLEKAQTRMNAEKKEA